MACAAAALRSLSRARNATLFTWRDFSVRTAAPAILRNSAVPNFPFFPAPTIKQPLRGQALREMQQGRFQHFAGQLAGSGQFRKRASGSLIQAGEQAFDGIVLLKGVGDQRVGFDCDVAGGFPP